MGLRFRRRLKLFPDAGLTEMAQLSDVSRINPGEIEMG